MLKVKYAFDGENPNEDLEGLIRDQMFDFGFIACGTGQEPPLRILEFAISSEVSDEAEQAFIESADRESLQDIVGPSIPLSFEFEPGTDPVPVPPPAAPPPSQKRMMFFGWCNQGSSDKVWGVISAQGEWITFWGGRTKKLQFKKGDDYAGGATLDAKIREKERKNYFSTSMAAMNALDPTFETRFEEDLILCMLANNYHTSPYA